MKFFIFTIIFLGVSLLPAFGESHPEYSIIDNPIFYELTVDDNIFSIPYEVDANVIAMAIDPELTSFLIGVENTQDSIFIIDLEHRLISATNNEFAILVNGVEVDYEIVSDADSSTFTFFVPKFTEEIEIIGTHVIPEFPFGVLLIFSVILTVILVLSRTKVPLFRL
ncbi:MAG: PEFG-CTERM sorting domain-containing protein [Nitrosopumilaceae archaeon]|nr:PEFG-CTERM sorting domain-containing protein [Nitrosopumilaceae archaeon]NIP09406.1 PEFG-CTERM sorting domain-containing protein [Nitrosopumilaceae archaeon]NIS95029.1 PEFG-CTERM sorting domain-containing protein [Nitrosopumilaceae archaeon]